MADQPVPVGEDALLFQVMRTMRAMRRLKPDPGSVVMRGATAP